MRNSRFGRPRVARHGVHGPERFLGRICSYGACPVMAGRTLPPQLERLIEMWCHGCRRLPLRLEGVRAPAAWTGLQLAEDDRPVAGEDYPPLSVPADGIRERLAFGVAANRNQVRSGIRVVHFDDLLRNDRPFVQFRVDVMGSGTHRLDTPFIGL